MTTLEDRALPIPPAITDVAVTESMHELARIWWDGERPQMMLRTTLKTPRDVGTLMAELTWNFAVAYAQDQGVDRAEFMTAVRTRWDEAQALAEQRSAALLSVSGAA